MPKKEEKTPKITTSKEKDSPLHKKLLKEYDAANAVLDERIQNKQFGYDTMDRLYQTYINKSKWPYSVVLPTPRGFTSIFNKGTRMTGGRLTGRIDAVAMDDEVGAHIATEHFKWSVNRYNQYSDRPVEAEVFMYDQNTRLYGAGFAMPYWKTEYKLIPDKDGKKVPKVVYDNWFLDVLNNRDVLTQPGRETIKQSDYVIIRRYYSLEDLERVQTDKSPYDESALNEIRKMKEGDGRKSNYDSVVSFVKGITDDDKRFEVCTTYYKDRWITWCPKKGNKKKSALILRDISNPYLHQEIPVVPLVYIPSEEDIIGMSELQPVAALLKILSALQSQFIELVNLELYSPIMADPNETRIDTWKYRPKAVWLVNNPDKVKNFEKGNGSLTKFTEVYKMIITEFLEAMGETGSSVGQADSLGGNKTATEIEDRAFIRSSRDNFNKQMLNASLRKIMYLVFSMLRDPKFTDKDTVVKIVGKDALEYFDKQGFSNWGINDAGYQLVFETAQEMLKNPNIAEMANDDDIFDLAYQDLLESGMLDQYAEPMSAYITAKGYVAKMEKLDDNNAGYLHVNPEEDYKGEYNFIPDVEALVMPNNDRDYAARSNWYEQVKQAEQSGFLAKEGFKVKHKDILTKLGELAKVKEAEQYIVKMEAEDAINQGGAGITASGQGGKGIPGEQTIPGNSGAVQSGLGQPVPGAGGQGMAGQVPLG